VLILDFDFIGIIIFLWFIFRGLRSSQEAKKRSAQRQKEPRPIRPKPKPQPEPVPSWFPFPEKPTRPKEVKNKRAQKSRDVKKPDVKKSFDSDANRVKKEKGAVPGPIQLEGAQWKAQGPDFQIDHKAVVNGIIWSEVLGPPRARKKRYIR